MTHIIIGGLAARMYLSPDQQLTRADKPTRARSIQHRRRRCIHNINYKERLCDKKLSRHYYIIKYNNIIFLSDRR